VIEPAGYKKPGAKARCIHAGDEAPFLLKGMGWDGLVF
jgi:hypothetical protein